MVAVLSESNQKDKGKVLLKEKNQLLTIIVCNITILHVCYFNKDHL